MIDSGCVGGKSGLLYIYVALIYRHKSLRNTVAHPFHAYRVKIYGHVARCRQQGICPGFPHFILIGMTVLSGHQPYYNHDRPHKQEHPQQGIFRENLFHIQSLIDAARLLHTFYLFQFGTEIGDHFGIVYKHREVTMKHLILRLDVEFAYIYGEMH